MNVHSKPRLALSLDLVSNPRSDSPPFFVLEWVWLMHCSNYSRMIMPLLPLNLLMTSNSRIDLLQYITSVSSGRRQHYNLLNVGPFRLALGNSCLILTELWRLLQASCYSSGGHRILARSSHRYWWYSDCWSPYDPWLGYPRFDANNRFVGVTDSWLDSILQCQRSSYYASLLHRTVLSMFRNNTPTSRYVSKCSSKWLYRRPSVDMGCCRWSSINSERPYLPWTRRYSTYEIPRFRNEMLNYLLIKGDRLYNTLKE